MSKLNKTNEMTEVLSVVFSGAAVVGLSALMTIAAVALLPVALIGVFAVVGYLLACAAWREVAARQPTTRVALVGAANDAVIADANDVGADDDSRLLEPFLSDDELEQHAAAEQSLELPAPSVMRSAAHDTSDSWDDPVWDESIPYSVSEWDIENVDVPIGYGLPADNVTPVERALKLVIEGKPVAAAARECGVSRSTLRRRVKKVKDAAA